MTGKLKGGRDLVAPGAKSDDVIKQQKCHLQQNVSFVVPQHVPLYTHKIPGFNTNN